MPSINFIKSEYPLHWLVWNNDYKDLDKELSKKVHDKEKPDARGRTPLMLAVTLGHLESARILLQHATNVNTENREGWTVVQEAVATGDPELLQLLLERRDFQRYSSRIGGIPELLQKLKEAPDFYVEMKWEFTSWVPLVSRMCPSDTYKVYKQGANVRIDTTLLGFDQTNWQRGNRSYVFKGQCDSALIMEVDHETQQVYVEQMCKISAEDLQFLQPSEEAISSRLTTPIVTTYIDTDKISFERNKSGIWGWRSDKCEPVNGYECKVFGASNVELVTKTRTEHLTETDKVKARAPKTPLQSFLGIAEVEEKQAALPETNNEEYSHIGNPCNITPEEYFDDEMDLKGRDIGRPKEVNTKIQKFKATLWLCENYPLSLQEQIMPIVDLMAISSSHFAKLKDFIQMQLPAGFPVKIEIPLFHVLNARITFGNIFGLDEEIPGVTRITEEDRISCIVDDSCFVPPASYSKLGAEVRRQFSVEEEDELLQFAIQQSLIEAGSEKDEVDIWEALRAQRPSRPTTPNIHAEEERQLQRAIQASLALYQQNLSASSPDSGSSAFRTSPEGGETDSSDSPIVSDHDLQMALVLSQREREEEERQKRQEEEMLEQVLQLSLTEK
ncbi:ankyrin repeat domain-containing protein 13D isoform X1 [Zootermopsis nevadensis]|uniref:Ankyrin repeat domain-containing protein 13B n=2 Tax=Zootermopsis nevadensis TaxID=136037 RepID=A0A067R6S1_ZOONE|nr:ankyrin repeat domain-containing protein 13D isoform X1 [Zootermopsis nevadensis]KDR18063.1 Ankyrin repeat domain-containing protein 13B [Zootermopsis nevadensis]